MFQVAPRRDERIDLTSALPYSSHRGTRAHSSPRRGKFAGSVLSRVGFALVLAMSIGPLRAEDELTANEIMSQVIARYANVRAYRDEAVSQSQMLGRRYNGRVEIAYAAPDSAMFRIQAGRLTRVFVANGESARKWSPESSWVDMTDRGGMFAAVKGATVALGDAAHWIGSLLLPREAFNAGIESLSDARRLPDNIVNKVPCYGVSGDVNQTRLKLWIGIEDMLIRRIEVADSTVRATIDYQPVVSVRMSALDIELAANAAAHE